MVDKKEMERDVNKCREIYFVDDISLLCDEDIHSSEVTYRDSSRILYVESDTSGVERQQGVVLLLQAKSCIKKKAYCQLFHSPTPSLSIPHPFTLYATPLHSLCHTPSLSIPHPFTLYATPLHSLYHTPSLSMPHPFTLYATLGSLLYLSD